MRCRLCLKDENKLCNSHIIPELFYKSLYDEPHRYTLITEDSTVKNKFKQKGIREILLCKTCERKLGNYEKYVNENLMRDIEKLKINKINNRIILKRKFDYKTLKLFQLSLLWRASISSHQMFKSVKLGFYGEKIRRMIYTQNPGKYFEFGCVMGLIKMGDIIGNGFMFTPHRDNSFGIVRYYFIFGGLYWIFIVSNKNKKLKIRELFLQQDGKLILSVKRLEDISYLSSFNDKVYAQGKLHH